jgi:hypothetical protein
LPSFNGFHRLLPFKITINGFHSETKKIITVCHCHHGDGFLNRKYTFARKSLVLSLVANIISGEMKKLSNRFFDP